MAYEILVAVLPVFSAILVAVFNNWEKINPAKKRLKEMAESSHKTEKLIDETKEEVENIYDRIDRIQAAQRTALQTLILEKCSMIQSAIKSDANFADELKHLIILYREYFLCGFNNQGRLYFNETIEMASEKDNALVRDLMNTYFSEYVP